VSGIGPKTAKLIAVSLQGKLLTASGSPAAAPARGSTTGDVVAALVGLGWNERLASQAVDEAYAEAGEVERSTVPALLRLALSRLGPAVRS
jgi:Holliday junction DNA helicase RuvA